MGGGAEKVHDVECYELDFENLKFFKFRDRFAEPMIFLAITLPNHDF